MVRVTLLPCPEGVTVSGDVCAVLVDLEHPNAGKKSHYCRIPRCHKKMDWDKSKIQSHFGKNHPDITLRSYYSSYIRREKVKKYCQVTDDEDDDSGLPSESRLPDGDSKILRLYVFGPSGLKDYGSTTLCSKI